MGAWTKNKVDSSQINGGQEYTRDSNPSLEQLNAITNNSFYAVDKADEALEKANSAFENNGTIVRVANAPVTSLGFTSDPQEQISSKANKSDLNSTNANITSLTTNKANKDLSNVTYPQVVADGVARTGAGDRVIERKVYSDGLMWYEKYASGWKRCGGRYQYTGGSISGNGGESKEILLTMPLVFNTTNYKTQFTLVWFESQGGHALVYSQAPMQTTTTITCFIHNPNPNAIPSGATGFDWTCEGY